MQIGGGASMDCKGYNCKFWGFFCYKPEKCFNSSIYLNNSGLALLNDAPYCSGIIQINLPLAYCMFVRMLGILRTNTIKHTSLTKPFHALLGSGKLDRKPY